MNQIEAMQRKDFCFSFFGYIKKLQALLSFCEQCLGLCKLFQNNLRIISATLLLRNCLLLVSIEVEELSAHCPVYKVLTFLELNLDGPCFFFSTPANLFGKQQESDYIQLSVMMQYMINRLLISFLVTVKCTKFHLFLVTLWE